MNRSDYIFFSLLVVVSILLFRGVHVTKIQKSEDRKVSEDGVIRFEMEVLEEEVIESNPARGTRESSGVVPGERLIVFQGEDDFFAFVNEILRSDREIRVLGEIDSLRAVRIFDPRFQSEALLDRLGIRSDGLQISSNYYVTTPGVPPVDAREGFDSIAFANNALEFLGIDSRSAKEYGAGVKVAILDGEVAPLESFSSRLRNVAFQDEEEPSATNGTAHGTAVASIIGSTDDRVPGVAAGAELLSYAIFGSDGYSDSFTLARAIVQAVEDGSQVINASIGSFGNSRVVREAVDFAEEHGAVIVASAGNHQASELAYPARYESVLAVGAVDASGAQLVFSNRGANLDLVAPGLGVYTMGANGNPVSFSGTSASAPFVTGLIAALLSEEPGLTGQEAAELLVRFANDAGPPGFEEQYGAGIPSLSRVLRRDVHNVIDPAIASNHLIASDDDGWTLQAVVENRGTTSVSGVELKVTMGDQTRIAVGPTIPANRSWIKEFPIDGFRVRRAGQSGLVIESVIELSGDVDTANNVGETTIFPPDE